MTTSTIYGRTIYAYSPEDFGRPGGPTRFQELSKSWKEGDPSKNSSSLSASQINELKSKYNTSNMSDADNLKLLQTMVEAGVLSKGTAEMIYSNITPLDLDPETLAHGRMIKYTPSPSSAQYGRYTDYLWGNTNASPSQIRMNFSEYYRAMYESARVSSSVRVKDSTYFTGFKNYIDLLDQLSGKEHLT